MNQWIAYRKRDLLHKHEMGVWPKKHQGSRQTREDTETHQDKEGKRPEKQKVTPD